MIIIVDGYNILKNIGRGGDVSAHDRATFVKLLNVYAKKKKHQIYLVFDGGSYGLAEKYTAGLVTVLYSGSHETADDVIRTLLRQLHTHDALLVSSDMTLAHNASRLNIPSLDAYPFYELVKRETEPEQLSIASDVSMIKTAEKTDPVLDMLMKEASKNVVPKAEDISGDRSEFAHKKGKQISRTEKKLRQKSKKL